MFGSLNARMWAWAVVLAVVLSAIGVAIAVVSPSGSGNKATTLAASPTVSPEETASPEMSESPEPSESPAESPSPTPSESPSATASAPASGNRDPASVDCAKEGILCSDITAQMIVKDGKLESTKETPSGTNYSGVPETQMTSTVLKPDQTKAAGGDQVGWIKVHVDVVNNTTKTFVFPQRKVALVVTRNGKDDVNETSGPYTEVPPGGALHADFLNPEASDGTYTWRAKVWFYAK